MIAIMANSTVITSKFHCEMNSNDVCEFDVSIIVNTVWITDIIEMPSLKIARNLVVTHGAAFR